MSNSSPLAVATIENELYKTELVTREHAIVADEPLDNGGKNLGPAPRDFVRMGLASCTAITLRMYANRKNMDVQKIKVSVSTSEYQNKTMFQTDIEINGNITAEEKDRLLLIAKKCPVHKMLTNPIAIEHTLTSIG